MNRNRPKNARRTLFVRMLTTYVLLTIATSTIVCVSSLVIFEHFYTASINESVQQNIANNHQNMADRINEIKDDVIGSIFMLQYGLVPQILNGDYISNNYVSIKKIYDYLNQLVLENSLYVKNIHLYYKNTNTLISSKYGLKYLNYHNGEGLESDWLNRMFKDNLSTLWVPARDIAYTTSPESLRESTFSFVTTYPMSQSIDLAEIMICIDFDEIHCRQRLNNYGKGINYILDQEGNRITSPVKPQNFEIDVTRTKGSEGYYLEADRGKHYLISYVKEPVNQWFLINQYPTEGLYRIIKIIKWIVILIYTFTTGVGIWVSFLLATKFYNPVKNLMTLIRSYDSSDNLEKDGEFNRIGSVINGLGGHINELQDTIDSSRSLLVAKFITDLALKRGLKREEIHERLRFLDITLNKSEYRFMKVDIAYGDEDNLLPSQAQIIKYRLINKLNLLNDEQNSLIVTDFEDNSILVLINTDQNIEFFKKNKLRDLGTIESVYSANVFIRIFLSDPVYELNNLSSAYKQIEDMKQVLFFKPALQVLTPENIISQNENNRIDQNVILKFEHMLYGGSEDIFDELDSILDEVIKQKYPIIEKQRVLMSVLSIIEKYLKDLSINTKRVLEKNIYGIFESFEDINMYRLWVINIIEKAYTMHNDSLGNASHNIISKVKSYIESHIDDDLSLSFVAGKVYLSPQYLSALFKKEEGVNFSTYIQHRKMDKAKILLLETEDNIEDVGVHVGYHTSHYFIKKFKETTGLTPKQFRGRNIRLDSAGDK